MESQMEQPIQNDMEGFLGFRVQGCASFFAFSLLQRAWKAQ